MVLLAFALRAFAFPLVFPGDGEVIFAVGDAYYHARRALFSFENFPSVLIFDRYINYPDGAHVPFPPLYDFLLAATARARGSGLAAFESAIAWFPAVAGALAAVPVYLAGRLLGGRAVGVGAALIATSLPLAVEYSQVGNVDHHGTVACLGAVLLWLYLEACRDALPRRRRALVHAGLVAARLAVLLSWNGSLLYLGIGEVTLAALLALRGERGSLTAASLSAWATALAAAPWVALLGMPTAGPYSAVELSRLHLLLFAGEGFVLGALAALEWRRPAPSAWVRGARSLWIAGVFAAGVWVGTDARQGLDVALRWMGQANTWGSRNAEQFPLFGSGLFRAEAKYGYFAYLVPVAPLAGLLRARRARVRMPALFLCLWTLGFTALTLDQVRYGNDLAAGAGVAFALLLSELAGLLRWRGAPRAWAGAAAALAGCGLLASAFLGVHLTHARGFLRLVRDPPAGIDLGLIQPVGSLVRFAQMVREATPETSGFLDGRGVPEYGILSHPNIGHAIHYVARRATPADNFGPYIGGRNFNLALRFYELRSEAAAARLARRLKTPYAITMDFGRVAPGSVAARLHRHDGLATEGAARFERFRLVTEGPPGGTSLGELFGLAPEQGAVPYKLFELVEGAVLEIRDEPGTAVSAQVAVVTPTRRRFVYRAETRVGEDGVARLRVPYATQTQLPAHPVSRYRVTVGETRYDVAVSDAQVREGAVVPVPAAP